MGSQSQLAAVSLLHLHLLSPASLSVSHAMCFLGSRTRYVNCVFRLWKSEEVLSCEPWNSGDRLPTLSLFSLILALHCRSQKAHQTFSGLSTRESHLKCEAFKALWIYISICPVINEYLTWYHGQTLVKSIQRMKQERESERSYIPRATYCSHTASFLAILVV